MNEIVLKENENIRLTQMDRLTACASFYHVDRIAEMYVMIYVIKGSIYVSEEDTDYEVNEGEMIFLNKGTHQFGRRMICEGTSWIYAHFQIEEILGTNQGLEEPWDEITLPKQINLLGHSDIRKRLEKICLIYGSEKPMARKRAALGLYELFLDVGELVNNRKTNSIVPKIDLFIMNNLRKDLSSEDFETEFYITYKYLNKIYKQSCGQSIMQTHFAERMKTAAVELRTANNAVRAVSDEMGFADPLYFSKCFKKYAGVSPRKYRQNAIRNFQVESGTGQIIN